MWVATWAATSAVGRPRIKVYYGSDSEVIHPPVDVDAFTPAPERGDFWLVVSRLSAYKGVELAVRAFNEVGLRLIVVGEGRELCIRQARGGQNRAVAGKPMLSNHGRLNLAGFTGIDEQ